MTGSGSLRCQFTIRDSHHKSEAVDKEQGRNAADVSPPFAGDLKVLRFAIPRAGDPSVRQLRPDALQTMEGDFLLPKQKRALHVLETAAAAITILKQSIRVTNSPWYRGLGASARFKGGGKRGFG